VGGARVLPEGSLSARGELYSAWIDGESAIGVVPVGRLTLGWQYLWCMFPIRCFA
jgi:hypothetical protein